MQQDKRMEYPLLEVDLKKLQYNLAALKRCCQNYNVKVLGVIKGFNGITQIAREYEKAGLEYIASSRLEHLRAAKKAGIKTRLAHIRIGMKSEIEDILDIADLSLQSEYDTITLLNDAAKKRGVVHNILLMVDIGDLREGYWDKEELCEVAYKIENELDNIYLAGVGTNIGCYGSISATPEKLREIADAGIKVERKIGRKLDIISGGASSSMITLLEGNLPKEINQLRLGEIGLFGTTTWDYKEEFFYDDVFTLKAEVIEIKTKPSFPVGERSIDAFGHVVEYEDIGEHKRALIAIGKVDYSDPIDLIPKDSNIKVLGASSDHTILDITKSNKDISLGDIISFGINYSNLVYLTNTESVRIDFV